MRVNGVKWHGSAVGRFCARAFATPLDLLGLCRSTDSGPERSRRGTWDFRSRRVYAFSAKGAIHF
jgi:hypothetical protein